ncbi:MAG: TfoX/Sxy family protein [Candidatus Promineifilaceae bacterium]|nr:TfoX/Sxy family protein [Candidatus Promineifilaceae bacterium]
MPTSPEYAAYILDQLNQHHPVTSRKMFGGVGIFSEDGMFALITSGDVLHFKVDDENRSQFQEAGMTQFQRMPYYQLPGDVLDSPDELALWMEGSLAAAKRAAMKKKK